MEMILLVHQVVMMKLSVVRGLTLYQHKKEMISFGMVILYLIAIIQFQTALKILYVVVTGMIQYSIIRAMVIL
jgi:hypothetical protein